MDQFPPMVLYFIMVLALILLVTMLFCLCKSIRGKSKKHLAFVQSHSTSDAKQMAKLIDSPASVPSTVASSQVPQVNKKLIEEFNKWGKLKDRDDLKEETLIGTGTFGYVIKGTLRISDQEVIDIVTKVTSVIPTEYTEEFIADALIVVKIDHPNVLPLIGMIFNQDRLPHLVYPYVEKGDLLTFLWRKQKQIKLENMIKFTLDIGSGMEYLNSQGIIHRNLAARNCFIDDFYNVLVGDFGFSTFNYNRVNKKKSINTTHSKRWRWQPFEVLDGQIYSQKSDVYSFAITTWEIFTRGEKPFSSLGDDEVKKHIKFMKFSQLAKPDICPHELFFLLTQCFSFDPSLRPSFVFIVMHLTQLSLRLAKPEIESQSISPQITGSSIENDLDSQVELTSL